MRLGFAVASHLNADVLLLDEVFAVGDGAFQRKCLERILEFKRNGGTIVFVSHDSSAVERLCERAILLRDGRLTFDGPTHEALSEYHALLADERDPAERAGGLPSGGAARRGSGGARVCGSDGEEREHLDAGDPFSLRLTLAAERAVLAAAALLRAAGRGRPAARRRGARNRRGRLAQAAGQVAVRFDVPSLPLAHGRFHFALSLAAADRVTSTIVWSTLRRSRSIRAAASVGPSCSTVRGQEGKSPPPQK